jgi:hypothetical protein
MLSGTTILTAIQLTTAIVRHPLVVSPDTTVMDAIAQISGVRSLCNTALYLHPLPLKPRKWRPQWHRIGICGIAQYDRALGHFRF